MYDILYVDFFYISGFYLMVFCYDIQNWWNYYGIYFFKSLNKVLVIKVHNQKNFCLYTKTFTKDVIYTACFIIELYLYGHKNFNIKIVK